MVRLSGGGHPSTLFRFSLFSFVVGLCAHSTSLSCNLCLFWKFVYLFFPFNLLAPWQVGYLRRMATFSEPALRATFLECREASYLP